jgi:hypothetical protein
MTITPTRICVIGNSHVNALKQGWEDIAATCPDHRLTFFASLGDRIGKLELVEGCLVPQDPALLKNIVFTSGGLDRIVLADYDVYLVYGLQLRLSNIRL